jgi:hypothetical protein
MNEKVRSNGAMIITGEHRNTEGGKNPSHHKSHMNWPGIKPRHVATDRQLTASAVAHPVVIQQQLQYRNTEKQACSIY